MHNIEIEQIVLGSILMDNRLFPVVSERISSFDLFEPVHADLFGICEQLISMGKKASPISVASFLPSNVNIGNLTVREYLARLAAASAIASRKSPN